MDKKEFSQLIQLLSNLDDEQKEVLKEALASQKESILGNEQILNNKSSNNTIHKNKEVLQNNQMSREERINAAVVGSRTITQQEPLIMFVGPASCGKSMVLMSLVDYLQGIPKSDYSISPNKNYILHDSQYENNCRTFMRTLEQNTNSEIKIPLDKTVDEVLLDVKKGGIRKYTMLEAPGEDFFDIGNPDKPYMKYIKKIIQNSQCPIYFVMLLDLHTPNNNFHDPEDSVRRLYENRLIEIVNDGFKKKRGDKLILLYNKFDLHDPAMSDNDAMKQLFQIYYKRIKDVNGLHYRFLGERLYPYFEVLPYISGDYEVTADGEGNEFEIYHTTSAVETTVANLWDQLKKR